MYKLDSITSRQLSELRWRFLKIAVGGIKYVRAPFKTALAELCDACTRNCLRVVFTLPNGDRFYNDEQDQPWNAVARRLSVRGDMSPGEIIYQSEMFVRLLDRSLDDSSTDAVIRKVEQ